MLNLLRLLDKSIGYAYIPPTSNNPSASDVPNSESESDDLATHLRALTGLHDIHDVQERWMDNKEAWDEWEGRERERLGREREGMGAEGM